MGVAIVGLTISCAPNVQSIAPVIDAESKPTPTINPESLCERLAEIKSIPFKDEPVYDPVYNDLIASGKKAVPCLIRKLTDTTLAPDPRGAPGYAGIESKVGDTALWVLMDITKVDFLQFLPLEVREDFKEEGVLAYFKYVRRKENRQQLQRKVEQWYLEVYKPEVNTP